MRDTERQLWQRQLGYNPRWYLTNSWFSLFPLGYLEKRALRFIDITDKLGLAIKPEQVENNQPIKDSENEKIKTRLECVAKRKTRHDYFRALVRTSAASSTSSLSSCPGTPMLLFSCSRRALVADSTTLLLSRSELFNPLLSCPVPTLLSYFMPTALFSVCTLDVRLSLFTSISRPEMFTTSSSCLILDPAPTHLIFSAFGIFKRTLSDEPLRFHLTSLAKLLHSFLTFDLLPEKTKYTRLFDMAFINSCPLAGIYTVEELDLSFEKCGCLALVTFNWLWQLELLDYKPVCIMGAISLAFALF